MLRYCAIMSHYVYLWRGIRFIRLWFVVFRYPSAMFRYPHGQGVAVHEPPKLTCLGLPSKSPCTQGAAAEEREGP
jgi:hypothetical protein